MITFEEANELWTYDPSVGGSCLVWKVNVRRAKKDTIAGGPDHEGYWLIGAKGRRYKAHRLVWLLHTKKHPEKHIDHIDGDASNNRIENLREANHSENAQNKKTKSTNTSGFFGVVRRNNSWVAQIKINKTHYYLGTFKSGQEAHEAYLKAKKKLHKFQPTLNLLVEKKDA